MSEQLDQSLSHPAAYLPNPDENKPLLISSKRSSSQEDKKSELQEIGKHESTLFSSFNPIVENFEERIDCSVRIRDGLSFGIRS
jgi:hypothetical protein